MKLKLPLLFFLLLIISFLHSQNDKDSLDDKDFEGLRALFYSSLDDAEIARNIARHTLDKANKDKNTREISNSYFRIYTTYFNDLDNGLPYLDSAINNSVNFKHYDLLAESYFYKANLFSFHGQEQLSLDNYLEARKYAEKGTRIYNMISYNVGVLKMRIDDDDEALEIFKECLEYDLEKNKNENSKLEYLETLYGLSIAYVKNKLHDSATTYTNEGYKLARSINDSIFLRFTYVEGNNEFMLGNYENAKDSLIKSIPYLVKTNDYTNLTIAYGNLASIYSKTGQFLKMIKFCKKIDSIFENEKHIYPSAISAYHKLIVYYEQINDIDNQIYYSKRILEIDSILKKKYRLLSKSIYKDFDSQNIVLEKKELEKTNQISYYITIGTLLVLILVSLITFYYRKKQKNYKSKFLSLLNENKESEKKIIQPRVPPKSIEIDAKIIEKTLLHLEEFEKELNFLNKGITLNILAKQCDTNSKYLSKIINTYKETSFRNYINDLRIDYAIKKLKDDKNFRKYTINAIADEVGFSNRESYAKAFQKRTGLNTSYFLKSLKNVEKDVK